MSEGPKNLEFANSGVYVVFYKLMNNGVPNGPRQWAILCARDPPPNCMIYEVLSNNRNVFTYQPSLGSTATIFAALEIGGILGDPAVWHGKLEEVLAAVAINPGNGPKDWVRDALHALKKKGIIFGDPSQLMDEANDVANEWLEKNPTKQVEKVMAISESLNDSSVLLNYEGGLR